MWDVGKETFERGNKLENRGDCRNESDVEERSGLASSQSGGAVNRVLAQALCRHVRDLT